MLPNSWFKKEKPLIGLLGMWGGVGSTLAGGGDAPGTVSYTHLTLPTNREV